MPKQNPHATAPRDIPSEASPEIQVLNYCSNAIEHLTQLGKKFPPSYAQTKKQLARINQLLDLAVKFLLPERGELIDYSRIDESTMDMLRLPFPLIALEVPFPPGGTLVEDGPMRETASTKRIALAWDESFAPSSGLAPDYKEPGVYVVAIYFSDESREWVAAPLGLFIPRNTEIRQVKDGTSSVEESLAVQTLLSQKAISETSNVLDARYFEVLPQLHALMVREMGQVVANVRMQLDVRDEMLCVWCFCMTVNCVNVEMGAVPAPAKLNAKRIKNGKPPLYEYKILQLPEPKATTGQSPQYKLEGSRAAPRTHLRRGHPRRLPDGRRTYVRAAMIGAGSAGVIKKDYRLG